MNNDDLRETMMTFGKHKGKAFNEIPRSYLQWVFENCQRMDPELKANIDEYLNLPILPKPETSENPF